jgi:hypothetical protein
MFGILRLSFSPKRGMPSSKQRLALEELERLRVKRKEASHALLEHWRQDHRDFSHKGASAQPTSA